MSGYDTAGGISHIEAWKQRENAAALIIDTVNRSPELIRPFGQELSAEIT